MNDSRETPTMKQSTKCMVLLGSLLLISAGVNSIFIVTAGGSLTKHPQQVQREAPAPQQTAAAECGLEPKHCSPVVR
jgi:hypothetical protein